LLFNSFEYLIFLPIVFILYYALKREYRWFVLLVCSYYFYMSWNAKYVVLILFTTVVSYGCAILLEKSNSQQKKKVLLASALIATLGVLVFFKYFNFLSDSFASILGAFAIPVQPLTLKILLPVGISFYTFQTLGYIIDVYRGKVKAEHHFGYYATFISFFPQLVAGPIERTANLLPQIRNAHEINFDYQKSTYGLKLMAWGFFKKIVIADTLALYVNQIYNDVSSYSGFALILATIFFAFQIYCDFSGYSDIAIGTAKLLGIDLMINFKSPYFSASIKEFWTRWHISLSTWFKDYVYIPLGGNRVSKTRNKFNLAVTFLISGIWHGANVTFVIWGFVHAAMHIIESTLFNIKNRRNHLGKKIIWMIITFSFVCAAWVFFRANTLKDAIYILSNCFNGIIHPKAYLWVGYKSLFISPLEIGQALKIILPLCVLLVYDYATLKHDVIKWLSNRHVIIRWAVYILAVFVILMYLQPLSTQEFIYFQF